MISFYISLSGIEEEYVFNKIGPGYNLRFTIKDTKSIDLAKMSDEEREKYLRPLFIQAGEYYIAALKRRINP